MVAAFASLLVSTAIAVFVTSQLLQGAARAIFWTSSQTHAVRGVGRPVDRLVDVNVAGNAGTLDRAGDRGHARRVRPAGRDRGSGRRRAVAVAGTGLLRRLPPYDRRRSAGTMRLLRRDGVDIACWASVVGGGWWAMLGSYIPVILVGAGRRRGRASAGS